MKPITRINGEIAVYYIIQKETIENTDAATLHGYMNGISVRLRLKYMQPMLQKCMRFTYQF